LRRTLVLQEKGEQLTLNIKAFIRGLLKLFIRVPNLEVSDTTDDE